MKKLETFCKDFLKDDMIYNLTFRLDSCVNSQKIFEISMYIIYGIYMLSCANHLSTKH